MKNEYSKLKIVTPPVEATGSEVVNAEWVKEATNIKMPENPHYGSGYVVYPNGLCEQWGMIQRNFGAYNGNVVAGITYYTAYTIIAYHLPMKPYWATATPVSAVFYENQYSAYLGTISINLGTHPNTEPSHTGFTIGYTSQEPGDKYVYWRALGFIEKENDS